MMRDLAGLYAIAMLGLLACVWLIASLVRMVHMVRANIANVRARRAMGQSYAAIFFWQTPARSVAGVAEERQRRGLRVLNDVDAPPMMRFWIACWVLGPANSLAASPNFAIPPVKGLRNFSATSRSCPNA